MNFAARGVAARRVKRRSRARPRATRLRRRKICLWSFRQKLFHEPKMDKDRTDVLAGGRLDSRGAQTGTKHSYATSEVRATRLLERVCDFVNAFRYNAQGAYWVRDKGLVAAFEAGKVLPKPRQLGRLPTDELRVSLLNYCATTVEDHEDEITQLLLAGGLDDAGRAAFCSVTRKDCHGDAVAEAAKRQSIADILSGVNPCGNHRVIASSRLTRLTGWISTQVSMTTRLPRRPRRRSGSGGRRRPRPRSCKGGGTCVRKSGAYPTANHIALCPVCQARDKQRGIAGGSCHRINRPRTKYCRARLAVTAAVAAALPSLDLDARRTSGTQQSA